MTGAKPFATSLPGDVEPISSFSCSPLSTGSSSVSSICSSLDQPQPEGWAEDGCNVYKIQDEKKCTAGNHATCLFLSCSLHNPILSDCTYSTHLSTLYDFNKVKTKTQLLLWATVTITLVCYLMGLCLPPPLSRGCHTLVDHGIGL